MNHARLSRRQFVLFLAASFLGQTAATKFELHPRSNIHHHHDLARRVPSTVLSSRTPATNATIDAWSGESYYEQKGTSGIGAMQLAPLNDRYVLLLDKAEQNPLRTDDGNHAWGAMLDTVDGTVRALKTKTNSFCAGGGFLGNGTLANFGGNPREGATVTEDGIMAIRLFTPGSDGSGELYEHDSIKLSSHRWYPSSGRLSDGSQIIFGGMTKGGFNNVRETDNPTLEFYPPKGTGGTIFSPFLNDTLPSNLFPHVFTLPDNRVFVASNTKAMIYDWLKNTETRLPDFPNGVRVNYPWSAGAVLLPLTPENKYTPEVLFCGGSTVDDKLPEAQMSSQTPASNQCARMVLTKEGIAKGWEVETMPEGRIMIDAITMPDGNVLLINGARTGLAGYGNVYNQVGASNADHPHSAPWLYRPNAPKGQRFQTGLGSTTIPRMYHSSASLLADGRVIVAGSNPNADVTAGVPYPTEYRVEYFNPPYMSLARPNFTLPDKFSRVDYGKTFVLKLDIPESLRAESEAVRREVKVAIVDLGFHTHAVSLNSKYVGLKAEWNEKKGEVSVTGPPNSYVYPKGPAWLYVTVNGIPSVGTKVMVGDGVVGKS